MGAIIPQGWPMLRCNQQRTGYTPGVSCFTDTVSVYAKWAFLVKSEKNLFFSSPVSADFNSDDKKDIVLGSWGGGSFTFPTAELYRGDDHFNIWSSDVISHGPLFKLI